MPVADALSEAARAGAEFVIGPLTREEVTAAADAPGRRPTLLALNFLPAERGAPAPSDFYQFALSPEDEARLAARRAIADGRRRAVALVPADDWGTRVLAAFREQLEADGGQLLGSAVYVPGQADFSRPIQSVLRLSDSQARRKRLESIVGSALTFQARRRGDIDCIFVPAPAAAARALRPQLRFHFAGDIPAYATSDAYEPGLAANQDLDGLIFPETPWLLGSGQAASRLRAAQRDAWGADAPSRGRLFAFGYDAFQLYSALRVGKPSSSNELQIDGATGLLSLDSERRVHRELTWAQISGGAARVLAVTKVP